MSYSVTDLDELCVEWHERWKNVINDETNRIYIAGRDLVFLVFHHRTFRRLPQDARGTIEQLLGNEGAAHYMSFYVGFDDKVYVFDPAGPGSPYYDPNIVGQLERKFQRDVVMVPLSPQRSQYDNFCQTWSLAWLCGGPMESMIYSCVEYQSTASPKLAEVHEFDTLKSICHRLLSAQTSIRNYRDDWQWCRDNWRTVAINFDKFRVPRASFRADHVRRRLF